MKKNNGQKPGSKSKPPEAAEEKKMRRGGPVREEEESPMDEDSRISTSETTDSLRQYYSQLADSKPMNADEEYELWDRIDTKNGEIRSILYGFAFVLREHVTLLKNCTPAALSDLFPASSFPDTKSDRDMSAELLKIFPWIGDLANACTALRKSFESKGKKNLEKIRADIVKLLGLHPINREKLREWYDVAALYRESYNNENGDLFAETRETLEAKLCMDTEVFLTKMKALDGLYAQLEELRQQVVTSNLRLVVSIAHYYHCSNVQTADMIQEGNLGLIRAIDKFDYRLGHRFSTYATWWIKQAVSRAIASQSRVIRLPAHMIATIVRINKAEQSFLQRNGHLPSDEELAIQLELPRERISAIRKMTCQTISLQAPLSNSSDKDILENLLCERESSDPMRQLTSKMLLNRLKEALDSLTEREQQIIRMRYGLDTQTPRTLVEVSKIFHLTRERIRQIEIHAIQKLRNPDLEFCYQDYYTDH